MRGLCIRLCCALLVAGASVAQAEEAAPQESRGVSGGGIPRGSLPRLTRDAVLLTISTRIMERGRVESWNETHRRVTISGHSVEIKLIGANIVVAVQFTPYVRQGAGSFLVAQGQIWMNTQDRGIRYHASMQTIPMQFGEPIYFFPLGPVRDDAASIEVILTIYPYESSD